MSSTEPLCLELEFARAMEAGDPHAFRFAPQDYLLRGSGGSIDSASFPWTPQLLTALDAMRHSGRDPALLQSIGETLRRFLALLGWARQEAQIQDALAAGRRVFLTIRSSAAELYALPWELLAMRSTGQSLGALPGVFIRYEWPQTSTAADSGPRSEEERILFAWSAAGGAVPAAEQLRALRGAAQNSLHPFDPERDVLAHMSSRRLAAALTAASQERKPIAVLHLLCHGQGVGSTFGLCVDADEETAASVVLDAAQLRQLLTPHARTLRLVVLCACDSGNSGALGNQLGSVAQALHRAGIAAVVASRYPLSSAGSLRLSEALYETLLVQLDSLESALVLARQRLAEDVAQMDWASLQIYARAADGDDTRPVVFRPYRGLLAFQPEHQRFLFGRDTEIAAVIDALGALAKAGKPRLLIVAGASGTGKSSLVLAGVVPRLLQGPNAHRLLRLRPSAVLHDGEAAGGTPVDALAAALPSAEDARPLLVVVDQFEEVFTHPREDGAHQALVQRLWALAQDAGSRVSVIVTLRVDFIGRCGELFIDESGRRLDSVAYDEAQRIFIGQLDRAALRTAIEEPARRVGPAAFGRADGCAARCGGGRAGGAAAFAGHPGPSVAAAQGQHLDAGRLRPAGRGARRAQPTRRRAHRQPRCRGPEGGQAAAYQGRARAGQPDRREYAAASGGRPAAPTAARRRGAL